MVAENGSLALKNVIICPTETILILVYFNILQIYYEITYLYVIDMDQDRERLISS